jgi:hypothetical protein
MKKTLASIIMLEIAVGFVVFISISIFRAGNQAGRNSLNRSVEPSPEINSISYWGIENLLRDSNFAATPKGQQYQEKVKEFLKDDIITYDELKQLDVLSKEVDDVKQINFNKIHKDGIKQELEFLEFRETEK